MTQITSVCVYCGSSAKVKQSYKDNAAQLGAILARNSVRLVYGGGKVGLMGIIAQTAFENGGKVIGVIPQHIQDKEIRNDEVSELFVVDTMHTRKRLMVEKSDGFVAMPGGFGTLDEAFEILTWKYLNLHDKPIVFLNVDGFYTPLITMVDHMIENGFTPPWHKELFRVVEKPEDVLPALKEQVSKNMKPDLSHI